ncbi:MAG: exodeoxyribonuclease VII small subunit [Bacteroides sp.]|nr:exodeoxyribonuclease VII small subunit [Bacteroides sp.]MCM1448642.1 exodeoxyribonuclease VII small subunit [Bacteroides sp.]
MKYEEAIATLETIARQLEQNELPIDRIADRLREAQKLVAFCRSQLVSVDTEIKKIIAEDATQ